jgi:hypothetical protein
MMLRTGSAPTSGPRSWRVLRLAGALVRSGDASVGPLDSAESPIARRGSRSRSWLPAGERGRAALLRAAWAVIVAAVWGYRPLARTDPREVRVTWFLVGMKPAPTLTDREGHTR